MRPISSEDDPQAIDPTAGPDQVSPAAAGPRPASRKAPSRRSLLTAGGAALGTAAFAAATPQAARAATSPGSSLARGTSHPRRTVPGNPPPDSRVQFNRWTTQQDFASGTSQGITILSQARAGIQISSPVGTTTYRDPYLHTSNSYQYSVWTSPVQTLPFGGNQLTAHWDADTPEGTFIKVEMHAIMSDGHSDWWTMGIWTSPDDQLYRTSVNHQTSTYGQIDTDTWNAHGTNQMAAYQLRLTLYRRPGLTVSPRVWQTGATASYVPQRFTVPDSPLNPAAAGVQLNVVPYAQNIHSGQYTQYGGGGEAWCSPTSMAMVVNYWGVGPTAQDMSWIDPSYADPQVDESARYSYDYGYKGTGNWPFTCAYATKWGLDAMVCRLNSLWELETLVAAGFPVITSQSFTLAENTFYASQGHLWVVIGFSADGNYVYVNDPASNSDSNVFTPYPRLAFGNWWLRTAYNLPNGQLASGSGGIAYVVKPHDASLPPVVDPANPSWPGGAP